MRAKRRFGFYRPSIVGGAHRTAPEEIFGGRAYGEHLTRAHAGRSAGRTGRSREFFDPRSSVVLLSMTAGDLSPVGHPWPRAKEARIVGENAIRNKTEEASGGVRYLSNILDEPGIPKVLIIAEIA